MKYLHVAWALLRASAMADLEYRANILVKILTDVIWYAAMLSTFEVLFRHTQNISGWTLESTRVFMGILFLTDGIWMILFSENLDRFSEKVRRGDLDLYLTKPVNAQFMLSIHKWMVAYFGNLVIVCAWLAWALAQLPGGVPWQRLPLLLILVPCGVLIMYSVRFVFSASAIIFTRADALNYIWYQVYRLGTRPDALYPPVARIALLTILPVGFVASVPARVVAQGQDYWLVGAAVFGAGLGLWLSSRFWRFALSRYTSASS
jgi:ABC-2 type transport system permease protein